MKRILIVDDPLVAESLKHTFRHYQSQIAVDTATSAGDALEIIQKRRPDALIVECWIRYGTADELLDAAVSDPMEHHTGLRLAWHVESSIREKGTSPIHLFLMTSQGDYRDLPTMTTLLAVGAKLYLKPFDTIVLEQDVCAALGIPTGYPAGI